MSDQGSGKEIGYVLEIEMYPGTWLFLGANPQEAAEGFKYHLDEIDTMTIKPRLFTRDELDNMPEFEGW